MASSNNGQGPHAFKTIQKDVKSGSISNLLLFHGEEQYLVQWSYELLKSRYITPGTEAVDLMEMNGSEADIDVIREFCETFSMFSEKKILHISDIPLLWKNASGRYSENFTKELCEYLQDLPESAIVIFTGKKDDPRSKQGKLFKTIEKYGSVYEFKPLDRTLLRGFIEKRMRAADKTIRPSVTDTIIDESGYLYKDVEYGLYNLENDLKKMIAHSDTEEILPADVTASMATGTDTNIFAMLDAVARKRKDEALRLMWNIVSSGENPFKVISMITGQLELMLKTKEMRSEGISVPDIAKRLNIHEFRVKKAASFADRMSEDAIRRILIYAYEIDGNIKTGLMDTNLALEYFVAEI